MNSTKTKLFVELKTKKTPFHTEIRKGVFKRKKELHISAVLTSYLE